MPMQSPITLTDTISFEIKKEREIIEDGRVAILYSPIGWFTYHGVYELLRDPEVVHLVRTRANAPQEQSSYYTEKIIDYCNTTYGDENFYGGADQLDIEWIELGDKFRLTRHDGVESIEYLTQTTWLEA